MASTVANGIDCLREEKLLRPDRLFLKQHVAIIDQTAPVCQLEIGA